jgi:hypothetical protein
MVQRTCKPQCRELSLHGRTNVDPALQHFHRGGTAAVQAMAAERLLRLGHRASVLRDCADRLKQAADGLALIAERDNAYYSQVC